MKSLNIVFISIGLIFMGLGIVGIIVPVLPTTPFILIASACFAKGSNRFDRWLKRTSVYKNYAEDYIKDKSMTFKRKAKLMIISDLMLAYPMITINKAYVRIIILLVWIWKYWYFIFKIKTKKE